LSQGLSCTCQGRSCRGGRQRCSSQGLSRVLAGLEWCGGEVVHGRGFGREVAGRGRRGDCRMYEFPLHVPAAQAPVPPAVPPQRRRCPLRLRPGLLAQGARQMPGASPEGFFGGAGLLAVPCGHGNCDQASLPRGAATAITTRCPCPAARRFRPGLLAQGAGQMWELARRTSSAGQVSLQYLVGDDGTLCRLLPPSVYRRSHLSCGRQVVRSPVGGASLDPSAFSGS
jgi:hypothetical protein